MGVGLEGQRSGTARAIVIGAGAGLGCGRELVSCGVGYVAVADGVTVALRDLVGQALYYPPDVGLGRAETSRPSSAF